MADPRVAIGVVGCGYVGLVTAACLASLGHDVTCYDISSDRRHLVGAGLSPFSEPGLEAILSSAVRERRLRVVDRVADCVGSREVVFVSVDTPTLPTGPYDLTRLFAAAEAISDSLEPGTVVAVKSTVPPGTARKLSNRLLERRGTSDVSVVSNPEFLSESTAVTDFMSPARIIIGADDKRSAEIMCALYRTLDALTIVVDSISAELIKIASNAFLATRVSFINEIESLCQAYGVPVVPVRDGIGADPRIGSGFFRPGLGFGGGCLPKDLDGLIATGQAAGVQMHVLEAVRKTNRERPSEIVARLNKALGGLEGRHIGIEGLAFKPGTEDFRHSQAIHLGQLLLAQGAILHVWDASPRAPLEAGTLLPAHYCDTPDCLRARADAIVRSTDGTVEVRD